MMMIFAPTLLSTRRRGLRGRRRKRREVEERLIIKKEKLIIRLHVRYNKSKKVITIAVAKILSL